MHHLHRRFFVLCLPLVVSCGGGSAERANQPVRPTPDPTTVAPTDGVADRSDALRAVASRMTYAETVARLRRSLDDREIDVIASFDPADNVHSQDRMGRPTTVFVFRVSGSAELLADAPTMALDVLQRMLVYSTRELKVFVVWRPPSSLADEHGVAEHARIRELDQLLEELAAVATAPDDPEGASQGAQSPLP